MAQAARGWSGGAIGARRPKGRPPGVSGSRPCSPLSFRPISDTALAGCFHSKAKTQPRESFLDYAERRAPKVGQAHNIVFCLLNQIADIYDASFSK
jgi:hypothetical protein